MHFCLRSLVPLEGCVVPAKGSFDKQCKAILWSVRKKGWIIEKNMAGGGGREIGKRFDIYCRWRDVTICAVHLVSFFWLLDMGPSSSFFHIISNKKRFNLQIMAAAILRKFSPVCNICKSQKKTLPLFIFLRRDNTIVLKLTGLQNKCALVQIRRLAKFVIWDCKIPSPILLNLRPGTVHWQAFATSF